VKGPVSSNHAFKIKGGAKKNKNKNPSFLSFMLKRCPNIYATIKPYLGLTFWPL